MTRLTLARGARNRLSSGALSGSGRPSDGVGADGNTYYRTDTGWTYTKSSGTWSVTSVDTSSGSTVLPFASGVGVYVSPYLTFANNVYGNVTTNGNTSMAESLIKLSLVDSQPSRFYGASMSVPRENIQRVASPTNANKYAHLFRAQKTDATTSGSGTPRTEIRFGDTQVGTWDGGGLELVEREWRAFAFSVYIPAAFKTTLFNLSGSDPAEMRSMILWQVHDNGQSAPAPMITLSAYAGYATRFYSSSITSAGVGAPPRLVWEFQGSDNYPAQPPTTPPDMLYDASLQEADFTVDEWHHFAGRVYFAPTSGGSPRFEVWSAIGSGAASKTCDSTAVNSYNQDPAYGGGGNPYSLQYGMYCFKPTSTWAGAATEVQTYCGDYYWSSGPFYPSDQDCLDAIAVLQARHQ